MQTMSKKVQEAVRSMNLNTMMVDNRKNEYHSRFHSVRGRLMRSFNYRPSRKGVVPKEFENIKSNFKNVEAQKEFEFLCREVNQYGFEFFPEQYVHDSIIRMEELATEIGA